MAEPNAWRCADCLHLYEAKVTRCDCVEGEQRWLPAYVSDVPPERKPLTDEQIDELINEHYGENAFAHDLIRRVVRAVIRESSRPNV